jgi:phenylacetate-coenzyme A ligase PaaK-like adenylate-forming protein
MNSWLSPLFFCRLVKGYFLDINRIWLLNEAKLMKFQNNQLKKSIKYAFTVPMYKEKYKVLNIKPADIKIIDDLKKLPLCTKDDIIQGFPDKLISNENEKKKNKIVNTSGSTGRPAYIYYEPYMNILYLFGWLRIFRLYNLKMRKMKITILWDRGNFNRDNGGEGITQLIDTPFEIKHYFNNIQILNATEKLNLLIKKMEDFNPNFITGHPGVLRELASLKKNGIGNNIKPQLIASGGGLLDDYTRKYIEDIFNAKLIDVYASVEGELTAFECPHGNYHVQSDLVYLEILNKDGDQERQGNTGRIAVTRFIGKGTPIIRYIGLNDMARLKKGSCKCGLTTQIIDKIEGRTADCIILPSGRIIPPISFIGPLVDILNENCVGSIKQFQILQEAIDKITILIVFDDKLRLSDKSIEELFKKIKSEYQKKLDDNVVLNIIRVEKLNKIRKNDTLTPVVITNVNMI